MLRVLRRLCLCLHEPATVLCIHAAYLETAKSAIRTRPLVNKINNIFADIDNQAASTLPIGKPIVKTFKVQNRLRYADVVMAIILRVKDALQQSKE